MPDAPVSLPDGGRGRLRELARDGFLLLAAPGADVQSLARCAAAATPAPIRGLEIMAVDSDGALAAALKSEPGEVWLVRPDAYIAAALVEPSADELATAIRRAVGATAEVTVAA
ncbi:aromatic-ring hydroxylase C-terminal domain-containing protein [Nocardia sp. NBC_00565]|uniref:aromatic-ring hydroxylase C-terminal domain-containing protein n=1 Tax=Nocardia sp. NBC_00565 TaxID=2975993 RepID=UPI002E7FE344|nr:hypothetical protein [Nocardia sp. NBC_00565]